MNNRHIKKDEQLNDLYMKWEENDENIDFTEALYATFFGIALMSLLLTLLMDIGDMLRNDLSISKFFLSLCLPAIPALLCLIFLLINLFHKDKAKKLNIEIENICATCSTIVTPKK